MTAASAPYTPLRRWPLYGEPSPLWRLINRPSRRIEHRPQEHR